MLISFSIRNYKTFKEHAEWSLVASADKLHEATHVVELPQFKLRLLKSAVVYGANGSGKSKLIEALRFMKRQVRTSFTETEEGESIGVDPFRLNTESSGLSSEFEVLFHFQDTLYRYGFEATSERVNAEWLFQRVSTKEKELFYRDDSGINFNKSFGTAVGALVKETGVRENTLLLSLAAQLNQPHAKAVQKWFSNLKVLSGLDSDSYWGFTMRQLSKPAAKQAMLALLKRANLEIEDALAEAPNLENVKFPAEMPKEARDLMLAQLTDARTTHRRYDANQLPDGTATFSLRNDESAGTQKFFAFTGPLLDVLASGAVLMVDELDSRLHPSLVCKIVRLFNSDKTNPNNAQLLFNTHDTNLLSAGEFRRDQIWFTEKDHYGAATLYSLADFKTNKVRKGDNFERNYIEGRYGAVPYLGDFTALPTAMPLADENAG
ncbi:AAA family ATPase [Hymenobacter sp. 5414T-23]|uniref:AAA family ATPase n=1 Tax=Hymenobacter sp. 5414T-23 TaxID=2932252 RepID=UPI001FD362AB|nr:ATP-binding protein [Hymenobacter sp. 5414T-23]UOQ80996.1 ATP-binding protein [Hymenobacter sp. 5414T-23]